MTLILTLCSRSYVLQVSDRLVTRTNDLKSFDPASNKNIIYHARDAVVTIGYSGPAYMEELPTDRWIAEKLRAESFHDFRPGEPAVAMGRAPQWLDMGQSAELLRSECERVFRQVDRRTGLYIVVAGWQQEHRSRWRPILLEIYNLPVTQDYETFRCERTERRWYQESGYPIRLAFSPDPWLPRFSHLSTEEVDQIVDRLSTIWLSPANARNVLVEAIRRKSQQSRAVGPDCMCINLPDPRLRFVEAVYSGMPYHKGAVSSESGRQTTFDVGYSPWVIGPNEVFPPMLVAGVHQQPLGPVTVKLFGAHQAPREGLNVQMALLSQRRPPPPGTKRP